MQNVRPLEGVYIHTQVVFKKLNINKKQIDRDTIITSKM